MLISLEGENYYSSFKFTFSYANNTIQVLEWPRKRKIGYIQVFGDSGLIVD